MRLSLPVTAFGATLLCLSGTTASAQCLAQRIEAPGTSPSDYFGRGLVSSAQRLMVGATGDSQVGFESGRVFVFKDGVHGIELEASLLGAGAAQGDAFGFSLAANSTRLLVGAPVANGFVLDSGRVHTFARSGSNWIEGPQLNPGEGNTGDGFGWSMAVDGNLAVVGAPYTRTSATGSGGGTVYVFLLNGTSWQYLNRIVPTDLIDRDRFGHSVAIDGNRVVVGAPSHGANNSLHGAVYVYDRSGLNWPLTRKLRATDPVTGGLFGSSVAVEGSEVLVGSPSALGLGGAVTGAVYLFDDSGGSWPAGTKLVDPLGDGGDRFGHSVQLESGRALVGAPSVDGGGNSSFGRAYGLQKLGSTWSIKYHMDGAGISGGDNQFGAVLTFFGSDLAVADPASGEGYVYHYLLGGVDCNGNGIPDDCDLQAGTSTDSNGNGTPDECETCASASTCSSVANSTGAAALMSLSGTQLIAANNLVLHAGPVPNQVGLFFYGPGSANLPLGNGTLCVSGPIYRMTPTVAVGNVLTTQLDITSPSVPGAQISANSTWYFQAWFRDTAAGGSLYNLSNAMKVAFCL